MKMYDTIKALAADAANTPEEIRKEFEAAMKQYEAEQKKAAAAKSAAAYASRLTEIANHMLNHTETAADIAFIMNTYITDKLGPQENNDSYITADGVDSVIKSLSILKDFTAAAHSDDETISKFLNDILGL